MPENLIVLVRAYPGSIIVVDAGIRRWIFSISTLKYKHSHHKITFHEINGQCILLDVVGSFRLFYGLSPVVGDGRLNFRPADPADTSERALGTGIGYIGRTGSRKETEKLKH